MCHGGGARRGRRSTPRLHQPARIFTVKATLTAPRLHPRQPAPVREPSPHTLPCAAQRRRGSRWSTTAVQASPPTRARVIMHTHTRTRASGLCRDAAAPNSHGMHARTRARPRCTSVTKGHAARPVRLRICQTPPLRAYQTAELATGSNGGAPVASESRIVRIDARVSRTLPTAADGESGLSVRGDVRSWNGSAVAHGGDGLRAASLTACTTRASASCGRTASRKRCRARLARVCGVHGESRSETERPL